jgi:type II secretory pathway predicted ATPase ExeA
MGVHRHSVIAWTLGQHEPIPALREQLDAWAATQGLPPYNLLELLEDPMEEVARLSDYIQRQQRGAAPPENCPMNVTADLLDYDDLETWGLTHDPFDDNDPEDIWLPKRLAFEEATLQRIVSLRRMVALVGPPGAGKTTLLRRMVKTLGRKKKVRLLLPATIDRKRINAASLSVAILRDLIGEDATFIPAERRSRLLQEALQQQDASGAFPVLAIDEAHLLSDHGLLAIKQVWDAGVLMKHLAVILIGQPLLRRRIEMLPELAEIAGRIVVREMKPMKVEDVRGYLEWRLSRAGADPTSVVADDVFAAIAARAPTPMAVNAFMSRGLRYARLHRQPRVDAQVIGRL